MTTGPYRDAFSAYRNAGWAAPLPLPPRKKAHPPAGYTGHQGAWPSYADCHTWADGPEGTGNIALRLPRHILGIDVDAYDGKPGSHTLQQAEQRHGPLPATWRSTSRDDGISGIRLYRIPEGLRWPGELGPAIELIQYAHRYAVAWPSIHPEGRTYRWISPAGVTAAAIPDPDSLPLLPPAWTEGLTGGHADDTAPKATLSDPEARQWLLTRDGATDPPCARMRRATDVTLTELRGGSSAHNAARDGVLRIMRLASEAHAGAVQALAEIHQAFTANVTTPARSGARDPREAEREWARLISGAVAIITADPPPAPACDCAGQITGLITSGAYPATGTRALTPLTAERKPKDENHGEPASHDDEPKARERTTWWPRNLTAILAGEEEEAPPAYLARTDGTRLFYPGKINALLGESESGKTWIALLAVAQALAAGHAVTYLDFEDTPNGIISRLRALALPDQHLTRLAYIGPDETLHAAASDDLRETLDQAQPGLIILDGVNAAMTLLQLDLDKNKDATLFAQLLLKPLTASGAAVVVVDHLPKNQENRGKGGIGAQAKRAMMTGCALTCDVRQPFGRGMTGKLSLSVDKDRPGHVRAISGSARNAGTAILRSDPDTGLVTVEIDPPDMRKPGEKPKTRLTGYMEKISRVLEAFPGGAPKKTIENGVKGGTEYIRDALATLIEEGYVSCSAGPRNSIILKLVRPYAEGCELTSPPRLDLASPRLEARSSADAPTTSPPRLPPVGGSESAGEVARTGDGRRIDTSTGEILTHLAQAAT